MKKKKKYEFWTDQLARKIVERDKFYYTDDSIPKFKNFVVKTSASLSGASILTDCLYHNLIW